MDLPVFVVFGAVYLGMILGGIPGLALDRSGVALLGAIALVALGKVTVAEAWGAMDVPTIALLFGLMGVSAQFRLGGFYAAVTRRMGTAGLSPRQLLGVLIVVTGLLSALLANDIICLAIAPVLASVCSKRGLNPVPFLIALACAANIGSAATLIGNPQNMLIGQSLSLSFARYLAVAILPALAGLGVVWLVIDRSVAGRWQRQAAVLEERREPHWNAWQTSKGIVVLVGLVATFVAAPVPREAAALAAAGVLLLSRRFASRDILALIDWHLLVLFAGLFVVNHALAQSGMLERALATLRGDGIDVASGATLFVSTAVLSNLVSNVPAVMLLLPAAAPNPLAGPILALASTLAGNLLIVGSIANIIVVEQAGRQGIAITWREHARIGVPVTVITLVLAALWLWLIAG
jgi:Na+/H+ antiporter NhaD/arsenite permease-like protein